MLCSTPRVFVPKDTTPSWNYFVKIPTVYSKAIDSEVRAVLVDCNEDTVEFTRVLTSEGNPLLRRTIHNTPIVIGEYHVYTLTMRTRHKDNTTKDLLLFRIRVDEVDTMNEDTIVYSRFVHISHSEVSKLEF